ncbi:MAG: putative dimethyl sulfoxide reductase chaperone [Clostridia bacterium]|nr:putative dimethyl sulfoxide reductase chaperone [Clostridia bacterium]
MDKKILREWLRARQLVYHLLARLYQDGPVKGVLAALAQEGFLGELAASIDNPTLVAGCRQMQAELVARHGELDEYQQELQEEYNRLFVGPGHLEAPPWESVYRSKERLLFGEETLAVREFYRSFGLESRNKGKEPDDHAGLEMEFMAHLSEAAADRVLEGEDINDLLEGQDRFLAEHMQQWLPALCRDMEQAARTDFFRGLALLTRGWMEADAAELKMVLAEVKEGRDG